MPTGIKKNENISFNGKNIQKFKYPLILIFFLLILIIIYSYLNDIGYKFDTRLGIVSLTLAIFALLITLQISSDQDKQLGKLEDIGEKTRAITETLQTDALIRENLKKFFPLKDENGKYKLFFPGDEKEKTLPLINAADSYAMYVISSLLGSDLNLRPMSRDKTKDDINIEEMDCNSILICDVNKALTKLFKFNMHENAEEYKENKSKLPAWFATFPTNNDDYEESYVINVYDESIKCTYPSPCEKICQEKAKKKDTYKFGSDARIRDYGILARLSTECIKDNTDIKGKDNKYIVIAGIHGFGTWIVASFLDDLIRGKKDKTINEKYLDVFFGEEDFISLISGDFNIRTYLVDRSIILDERVWKKKGDNWEPVKLN